MLSKGKLNIEEFEKRVSLAKTKLFAGLVCVLIETFSKHLVLQKIVFGTELKNGKFFRNKKVSGSNRPLASAAYTRFEIVGFKA
jgi:hypothetical protein